VKTELIPVRKLTKVRITDPMKVPSRYVKEYDLAMIKTDLQAGVTVPGAELYQETIITRQ
jgi:hypothetical protein